MTGIVYVCIYYLCVVANRWSKAYMDEHFEHFLAQNNMLEDDFLKSENDVGKNPLHGKKRESGDIYIYVGTGESRNVLIQENVSLFHFGHL